MSKVNASSAETAILRIHEQWIEHELRGESGEIVSLCSESIVFQPPFGPRVRGKEAVKRYLSENAADIACIECSEIAVRITEKLAVKTARFATRLEGFDHTIFGSHFWLLEPEWRVVFVTWSLDELPAES